MDHYRAKSNVIFDDINLSHYNAFAFSCNLFDRPERDVDVVSVPGRHGDLVLDNGRYKNVAREYHVQVTGMTNIESLIREISRRIGYFRLEDDYDSEVYFEARLAEPPSVIRLVGDAASILLKFDRKPQRYLKSGENVPITDYTYLGQWKEGSSEPQYAGTVKMVINNPYEDIAYPLIMIPGGQPDYSWRVWLQIIDYNYSTASGEWFGPSQNPTSFYIQKRLSGTTAQDGTEVDSEKRSVKHGNSYEISTQWVKFTNIHEFPIIKPGVNYYYFTFARYPNVGGGDDIDWSKIKAPQIYPRWWKI